MGAGSGSAPCVVGGLLSKDERQTSNHTRPSLREMTTQASGTGQGCGGVGGAEEATNRVADRQVVPERGALGRRARVEPDVDAVPLAAVGVIHPHGDLVRRRVVPVGQYLMVETQISGVSGGHGHQPEGRRYALVEVGGDLRPL